VFCSVSHPRLQASRVDLTPALKQMRGKEAAGHLRRGWRRPGLSRLLVVSQIAISLLLLVAAGLFVQTLSKLQAVATGFHQERILLFSVNAWQAGYRNDALTRFYAGLQERLSATPGVTAASYSNLVLLSGSANMDQLKLPGAPRSTSRDADTSILTIGPGFLSTVKIPILLGREIGQRDTDRNVAVVNELLAKKYFGAENPLGRHVVLGDRDIEIIGVAANARYDSIKRDIPSTIYVPCCVNVRGVNFEIRAAGDAMSLAGSARELVRQADSRIPVTGVTTQERVIEQSIGQERTFATLCTGFSLLAVSIACVGLYGTMAYSIARRTGEIGIRMALGAERRRVVWMVLREVLLLAALGLVMGITVAYASANVVETFLFGMKARDTSTLAAAPLALPTAALAAGYAPARASRIDPMTALRQD
jgi:predicted permease